MLFLYYNCNEVSMLRIIERIFPESQEDILCSASKNYEFHSFLEVIIIIMIYLFGNNNY